jgi:hypothetical protein
VALTWLQVHYADTVYAQATGKGLSAAQGEYLQRRQDRAQKRLLLAVMTQALVQRLLADGPAGLADTAAVGGSLQVGQCFVLGESGVERGRSTLAPLPRQSTP